MNLSNPKLTIESLQDMIVAIDRGTVSALCSGV